MSPLSIGGSRLWGVKTLDQLYREDLAGLLYVASLMGVFGFLALVLSAIGVYGVMAQAANEPRHEIGVRIALGASRGSVLSLMIGRGVRLAGIGSAIGLVASLGMARVIEGMIFGDSFDPSSFAIGVFVLSGSVLLACYVPARRAIRADPVIPSAIRAGPGSFNPSNSFQLVARNGRLPSTSTREYPFCFCDATA